MSSKVHNKDVLQAVLLADDFTTSLTPIQNFYPSILMPVINIPLFDYTIETLVRSRIQEVYLYCSSHMEQLKAHVNERNYEDITITLIISDGCSCLGDALRDIDTKGWIRGHFILIRGNAFVSTDLKALFSEHLLKVEKDKGTAMTMVLRKVGSTRNTLLSEETTQVVSDRSNNKILQYTKMRYAEKKIKMQLHWFLNHDAVGIDSCYLDTHIYLCSPSVLPLFADNFDFQTMEDFIRGVLLNDEILDTRIYWQQLKKGYALAISNWKIYRLLTQDILREYSHPLVPDGFSSLKNFACMPLSTYKHKTATLAIGCSLEQDCIVGRDSTLGNDTTVTKSVIADNCVIGKNVNIHNSYVFSNVKIENNCVITNSVLFPNCIVKNDSQLDGCIMCPGINVEARSEYVDTIVESAASGLSQTKMSELDGFLYFKQGPAPESDDSSSDSSSSENGSTVRESPIPDDTNMFLSEVIDSLLRGYQDRLNCENLILEINSSRYAYNVSIREVTYNVVKAILSLPLHYLAETKTPVTEQNYQKKLKIMISYFITILFNYVKNEEGQEDCLRAIEDVASVTDELLQFTQYLLHQFYERDLLSEEKILEWYNSKNEDADPLHNKVRKAVEPFIKWLQEAEEDSTEDEND